PRAARPIRRRRLDHRRQIAGALQGPGGPGVRGILPDRHAGLAAPRPARRDRDETTAGITAWGVVPDGAGRKPASLRSVPLPTPHAFMALARNPPRAPCVR